MSDSDDVYDQLLCIAARHLTGHRRRTFQAQVTRALCGGNPRQAERRFGWGRANIDTGCHEIDSGIRCVANTANRGNRRSEDVNPRLAADIRALVEPHTQADPELKSDRRYTNLSAAEVRDRLRKDKGYTPEALPSESLL